MAIVLEENSDLCHHLDGKGWQNHHRHAPSQSEKNVRTPDLIASVAAAIKEDLRLSMETIATAHEVSEKTFFNILHQDLGLDKKAARQVPRLLNDEQKQAWTLSLPSTTGPSPCWTAL
jgi:hypothetical protein